MQPDDLTPVAQDYLKVIWSRTEWGGDPITTGELAARFGTSPPNATETVRRLAGQGLLEHTPYRPVRLTPQGTAMAIAMVRRHRLIETYLVSALGYGWDEVHDEAERLEHAASDALVDRLDAALGHPRADPHGDPIPDAEGRTGVPPQVRLLSQTIPGVWTVVQVSDADPGLLTQAQAEGLRPGEVLRVLDAEPLRIATGTAKTSRILAPALAGAVRVAPAP